MPRGARSARVAAVALGAGWLLPSCATPESEKTPAQVVDENSDILRNLASWDEAEQRRAITWIKDRGRERGTALILYILGDPTFEDYRSEVILARILADWRDPRAIAYLLRTLQVPDAGAARIASEGLAVFGDNPAVLEALEEMLGRPAARERLVAAETLARIGGRRVTEIFGARFAAETDPEVRGIFLIQIMKSRHPRREEFLVEALTDADGAIREEAWNALRRSPDLPPVGYSPEGALEDRARDVAALRMWIRRRR